MPEQYTIQRFRDSLAIVWWEDGKRRRHSLGTTDPTTAEAAARRLWRGRNVGKINTVGEAVEFYLSERDDMASIKRARVAWKAAAPYWKELPIARVDEEVVKGYAGKRPHCRPITIRNELAVIRAALNFAQKKNRIDKAPFIQMPKLAPSTIGHLSRAEFRRLLDGAKRPHVALFMKLAVATGARSNALLDLTWDRVDFERGLIYLNPRDRVQTSKYRATVPMNDQIRAELEKAKEGALSDYVIEHGRSRVGSIKKGFAEAARRAGIQATPHMLRHTSAVWQAEAGIPIYQIAQFLGHSDSRITERVYGRFSPEFLKTGAEAVKW